MSHTDIGLDPDGGPSTTQLAAFPTGDAAVVVALELAEQVLGADTKSLVVTAEDVAAHRGSIPALDFDGSMGAIVLSGFLEARRSLDPNRDPPWIVVVVLGDEARFVDDVRHLVDHEPRLVVVVLSTDRAMSIEVLEHRLTELAGKKYGAIVDFRPPSDDWAGDGIDESLFDLLHDDPDLFVVAEREATSIATTRAEHPGRCLLRRELSTVDVLRAVGLAAGGGRVILLVSSLTLARLRGTIRPLFGARIPIDIVVPTDFDRAADVTRIRAPLPEASPHFIPARELGTILARRPAGLRYVIAELDTGPAVDPSEQGKRATEELTKSFGFDPDDVRAEHEAVLRCELGRDVDRWYERYAPVGSRSRYMWQWCVHGAELTGLPCVDREWSEHVRDTKVLAIFLAVLLDDAVDVHRDSQLLGEVLHVVERAELPSTADRTDDVRRYLDVTLQFVGEFEARVRTYPRYHEFSDLLRFDCEQFANAVRYGDLVGEDLELLSEVEHDLYLPHGMHMQAFATLDLMCSPAFERSDHGRLREAIWHAARMGRAGNVLGTWHREIGQRDFTSGVFARALLQGDVTIERLGTDPPELVAALIESCGHESAYRSRWLEHRRDFVRAVRGIRSVDLEPLVEGQDRFCRMHLAGRGFI